MKAESILHTLSSSGDVGNNKYLLDGRIIKLASQKDHENGLEQEKNRRHQLGGCSGNHIGR
jgi:hypothetical protein